MKTPEKARFDTKLSKEQKELFEYAALVGGYRTLTDFVVSAAAEKANEIIERQKTILASAKDREVFFDALMHPQKPNKALTQAHTRYKKAVSRK